MIRSWSDGVENQVRTLLKSHGLLFFASGSASGLVFLLALFVLHPFAGASAVAGALVASLVARLLGADRFLVEAGVFGYNGVLAGLGSTAFVTPQGVVPGIDVDYGWPMMLVVCSSACAGLLMRLYALTGCSDRPGLPALTFPSIISVWVMGKIFVSLNVLTLSPDAYFHPYGVNVSWYGWEGFTSAWGMWFEAGLPYLPVAVLLLLGYAIENPRRIPAVVISTAVALSVGGLVLGENASRFPGFTWFTAAPLGLALGFFFVYASWRSAILAIGSMIVSAPLWQWAGLWAEELELPLLTLPFALTAMTCLAFLRLVPRRFRAVLPQPVPLHRVGSDAVPNFGPSRAAGMRYWQEVEEMQEKKAPGVPSKSIKKAVNHLVASKRIVALTGAGISTESGVPDYRSGVIAWTAYNPEDLVYSAFLRDENARRTYWRMSQDFYVLLREAKPNQAHAALAQLEKMGKLSGIITQNVDRLHQRAGNSTRKVVEIHGNEFGVSCLGCGASYSRDEVYRWILHGTEVPYCLHCQGLLKPDSIAFGQPMVQESSRQALALIDRCDLLIVAGTSLNVEPVASLVARASANGARLIIVNYTPTDFDAVADVLLRGSTGEVLDELVAELNRMQAWVS
ncbi:MAG: NAD-dependent deacetylase [Planctomycetota bacterium]